MRSQRYWALALALAAAGCGGESAPERQAPPVTVDNPVVRTINEYAVFTGTSRAVERAEVVARVAGRLDRARMAR